MAAAGGLARAVPSWVMREDELNGRASSVRFALFVPKCTLHHYLALLLGNMCGSNVTNSQRISNSMIASAVPSTSIRRWEGVHNTEPSEERPPGWM